MKNIRQEPGKVHQGRRRGWKKKLVRFSSLGHSPRTYAIPPHPHVERSDGFSSWKSLFFYRCTDIISFAPLKSQPARKANEPAKPRGPIPVQQQRQGATRLGWDFGDLFSGVLEQKGPQERVGAYNDRLKKSPAPVEPKLERQPAPVKPKPERQSAPVKPKLENPPAPAEPKKAEEKMALWEMTKEERRADYIREKPVAIAPPPCSPKTIYVLASFVRQPSIGASYA